MLVTHGVESRDLKKLCEPYNSVVVRNTISFNLLYHVMSVTCSVLLIV